MALRINKAKAKSLEALQQTLIGVSNQNYKYGLSSTDSLIFTKTLPERTKFKQANELSNAQPFRVSEALNNPSILLTNEA
jgi:hypothetical protein